MSTPSDPTPFTTAVEREQRNRLFARRNKAFVQRGTEVALRVRALGDRIGDAALAAKEAADGVSELVGMGGEYMARFHTTVQKAFEREDDVADLRRQLEDERLKRMAAERECSHLKVKLAKAKQQAKDDRDLLATELDKARIRVDELTGEAVERASLADQLLDDKEALIKQRDYHAAKAHANKEALHRAEKQHEEQTIELCRKTEQLERTMNALRSARDKVGVVREMVEVLQGDVTAATGERDHLRRELAGMERAYGQLERLYNAQSGEPRYARNQKKRKSAE